MNIFALDKNPIIAARMHCDQHVPKMIVESAQMLSTAHRVLDGEQYKELSKSGKRMMTRYRHSKYDDILYKAAYINHPCTVWTRKTLDNYNWLYNLFIELGNEYCSRYNKVHLTINKLQDILAHPPENIKDSKQTPFALAVKETPKQEDEIQAYRLFYKLDKARFATWNKGRAVPEWWNK